VAEGRDACEQPTVSRKAKARNIQATHPFHMRPVRASILFIVIIFLQQAYHDEQLAGSIYYSPCGNDLLMQETTVRWNSLACQTKLVLL
jgi:hypothetical protein